MQRNTSTSNRATSAPANRTSGGSSRNTSTGGFREGSGGSPSHTSNAHAVACRKCKSTQITAGKKGYNFGNLFKTLGWMALFPILLLLAGIVIATLFITNSNGASINVDFFNMLTGIVTVICWISIILSLPVGIMVGFSGRNELVNGCMNCGYKWSPSKKK